MECATFFPLLITAHVSVLSHWQIWFMSNHASLSLERGWRGWWGSVTACASAGSARSVCVLYPLAGADREGMVAMITHPHLSQIWMEGPFLKKKVKLKLHCLETGFSLGRRHLHARVCARMCRGEDNVRDCGHGWGWLKAPWWGSV